MSAISSEDELSDEIIDKTLVAWDNEDMKDLRVGVIDNLTSEPIHGLRHPNDRETTDWLIWTGEYSEASDFLNQCVPNIYYKSDRISSNI